VTPKDNAQDEELLARYRRASDTDVAAPTELARSAILAESRRVAEQLAKKAPQQPFDVSRPAANDARWKITAFGTVGAGLLAALLIAPHFWESERVSQVSDAPATVPNAAPAAVPNAAPAVVPNAAPAAKTADADAAAPAPATVPRPKMESIAPSPPSESLEGVVVTQTDRKTSKASAEESRQYSAPAPSNSPGVVQNYARVPSAPPPVATSSAPLAASSPPAAPPAYSARAAEGGALSGSADRAARARVVPTPSSLQAAAGLGDARQAAVLLDQGVAVDVRDEDGRTPLMLAVVQGRLEVVRLLLARGADPNAADNAGRTPLQQATDKNLRDIAALLERAGAH
jgi:hypothetical protein